MIGAQGTLQAAGSPPSISSACPRLYPTLHTDPLGKQGLPVARSLFLTNDGCPTSARFWQMWDSKAVHRSLSTATGLDMVGHLHLAHSGANVRGIPHLPQTGRYGPPVVRYRPGREKCQIKPKRILRP